MTDVPPTNVPKHRVPRWPRATPRTTLAVIILIATLPLALMLALRTLGEMRDQRDALAATLRGTARTVGTVVDRELSASREALRGLASDDALQRSDIASFEQRLRAPGTLRPAWDRLVLLDAAGRPLSEVAGRDTAPVAPAELQAVAAEAERRTGAGMPSDPIDDSTASRATWVGVPVTTTPDRRWLLAARVGLDTWQALIEGVAPADGHVTLFDGRRRTLARTDAGRRFIGQPLPAVPLAAMGAASSGHAKTAGLGGGETYVAWQRLHQADWGVEAGIDAAPFDAAQTRAVVLSFGAAIACMLLGIGLSMAFARRAAAPLQPGPHGPRRQASAFETIFQHCPTGLAFAHDRACTSVWVNPAMDALLPGAAVGVQAAELEVLADGRRIEPDAQPLAVAAREGRPVAPIELEVRRPGRPAAFLLASAVPLPDGGGALASVIDVTARRLTEIERHALMSRETLARRDAEAVSHAKDQLLSMLGHELRNPLNALVTSAEVLRAAPPGSAMAESARSVVMRQTLKMSTLIDRLLEAGRLMADDIALAIEPVELGAAVRASLAVAGAQARDAGHRFELVAAAPAWVRADPARVAQLMAQLLDNALRHSPPGAAVTVDVRRDGADAVVAVRDSGPAIDPALLPRVFEPFAQGRRGLDRSTAGPGLGLALAKRLVELHGGSIGASSSSGGSEFAWRLPLVDPPRTAEPQAAPRRVGVVDGDPAPG